MVAVGDIWYRIEDPFHDDRPPMVYEHTVVRVTPKGVRLQPGRYDPEHIAARVATDPEWVTRWSKFVLLPDDNAGPRARFDGAIDAGRRWAYPTLEMARGSYLIRKQWQLTRAKATVDRCEAWLARYKAGTLWDEQNPTTFLRFA